MSQHPAVNVFQVAQQVLVNCTSDYIISRLHLKKFMSCCLAQCENDNTVIVNQKLKKM